MDGLGVDDELTNDVASLRAILNESVTFSNPADHVREQPVCDAVSQLQECLEKNIALQNLLHEKLRQIELALMENEEKLCELKRLAVARRQMTRGILSIWRMRTRHNDYLKDHRGQVPPSLSVTNSCNDSLGTAVYATNLSWKGKRSNKGDEKLTEGVRRQIIDHITRPLQSSLRRTSDDDEKMKIREKIQEISKRSTKELVKEDYRIDWSLLAYEQFTYTLTAINCELRWKGNTNPLINKGVWPKADDKNLIRLVKEHNYHNWNDIAVEMGTMRTGFMCLQRYQQSLNPSMFSKVFSNDDDRRLTEAVNIYGDGKWNMISAYVGGKTPSQCSNRWRNTLRPDIKRGRWPIEEDKVLREAVRRCGIGNWTKIASLVPGRTQSQCRERWVNHLDEKISKTSWTAEEDSKLKEICQRYTSGTIPWSTVAREMVTRTDNMCLIRWQLLSDTNTIVKHYTKNCKQKDAVMHSFIGRKRFRHSLSQEDIEEDMLPETVREKLKSYKEKVTKIKRRQANYYEDDKRGSDNETSGGQSHNDNDTLVEGADLSKELQEFNQETVLDRGANDTSSLNGGQQPVTTTGHTVSSRSELCPPPPPPLTTSSIISSRQSSSTVGGDLCFPQGRFIFLASTPSYSQLHTMSGRRSSSSIPIPPCPIPSRQSLPNHPIPIPSCQSPSNLPIPIPSSNLPIPISSCQSPLNLHIPIPSPNFSIPILSCQSLQGMYTPQLPPGMVPEHHTPLRVTSSDMLPRSCTNSMEYGNQTTPQVMTNTASSYGMGMRLPGMVSGLDPTNLRPHPHGSHSNIGTCIGVAINTLLHHDSSMTSSSYHTSHDMSEDETNSS